MKKEIKTFLKEFLPMWPEIWQQFGKYAIQDLTGGWLQRVKILM